MSESGASEPPEPLYWIGVELRQPPTPPPPPPSGIDTVAKTLAGGYVFVGFILATIGGLQGGLQRLLINHPWWTVAGLLATGAGIALAFVDAYVIRGKSRLAWMVLALGLFAFGLGVLLYLSTKSISENERPAITTTASVAGDGSKLEGHVTALGVKSSQWVYVSVNGIQASTSETGDSASSNETGGKPKLLYQTRAGPDRNGKVDLTFNIPVSFGRFAFVRIGATRASNHDDEKLNPCFVKAGALNQSCATVYPPQVQSRPTLSTTWEKGADKANVFNIAVKATGSNPDFVVLLLVTNAKRKNGGGKVFYRSIMSASATGVLDASAKVRVPGTEHAVCVTAITISSSDDTTLKAQSEPRPCSIEAFDRSNVSFAEFRNLP